MEAPLRLAELDKAVAAAASTHLILLYYSHLLGFI